MPLQHYVQRTGQRVISGKLCHPHGSLTNSRSLIGRGDQLPGAHTLWPCHSRATGHPSCQMTLPWAPASACSEQPQTVLPEKPPTEHSAIPTVSFVTIRQPLFTQNNTNISYYTSSQSYRLTHCFRTHPNDRRKKSAKSSTPLSLFPSAKHPKHRTAQ